MVTAVMGARGGVGATTLAVALASRLGAGTVLVDLDVLAGGLDTWLGIEDVPGVRWSGLHLAGGDLDPHDLVAALPRSGGTAVLAADRAAPGLSANGVAQVLDVLADHDVVVDLPRLVDEVTATAVERCGLLVLVTPATVGGTVAAHTVARAFDGAVPVGLVLVGEEVSGASAQAATGVPVLGAARDVTRLVRVASGIADGLRP